MFYWVRRKLNFSRKQWLKLPWFEQEMYLKGMVEEMEARAKAGSGDGGASNGANTSTFDLSGGGAADFEALGIPVERV